jgi:predicted dithiol-disulfide oxidoreductase (DUF899 family)
MKTPPIVSPEAWEATRLEMLVKEKAFTRAPGQAGGRASTDAVDAG